jgi:predicted nucleic acid-binding protein
MAFLFDEIHIPRRVREEFRKRPQSRRLLTRLRTELAPYKYCNQADEISVKLLLAGDSMKKKPRQDEGEAEAIIQASQIGAPVVILDEKRARRWALARGLQCHGTLWILDQLRARELIGPLRPLLRILDREQIRLPRNEVQRLLAKFDDG